MFHKLLSTAVFTILMFAQAAPAAAQDSLAPCKAEQVMTRHVPILSFLWIGIPINWILMFRPNRRVLLPPRIDDSGAYQGFKDSLARRGGNTGAIIVAGSTGGGGTDDAAEALRNALADFGGATGTGDFQRALYTDPKMISKGCTAGFSAKLLTRASSADSRRRAAGCAECEIRMRREQNVGRTLDIAAATKGRMKAMVNFIVVFWTSWTED
ncbi:hypothetical protein C8R44DRAFT_737206 [Mycena epipterygia]|nr:hypothetical protein C8R44DRAFT_737206 [Mycena epipterygia]